jgi:hypothetical protein
MPAWFSCGFYDTASPRLLQDGSGTLELDEFKRLIDQSPMAGKYGEQQLLQMFSELTSQDGLLTKHDWTNLFHHVQVPLF